jgi:hypothetical protein
MAGYERFAVTTPCCGGELEFDCNGSRITFDLNYEAEVTEYSTEYGWETVAIDRHGYAEVYDSGSEDTQYNDRETQEWCHRCPNCGDMFDPEGVTLWGWADDSVCVEDLQAELGDIPPEGVFSAPFDGGLVRGEVLSMERFLMAWRDELEEADEAVAERIVSDAEAVFEMAEDEACQVLSSDGWCCEREAGHEGLHMFEPGRYTDDGRYAWEGERGERVRLKTTSQVRAELLQTDALAELGL